MEAAFLVEIDCRHRSADLPDGSHFRNARDQIREPVLQHIVLPGAPLATPMTNYAGFCLILRLCAGRSAISDAMIDEATNALGRLKVGDQTLHGEVDRNAAAASAAERAFVLGPAAAASQQTPIFDLNTALMEAAKHPETQASMKDYWNHTLTVEAELKDFEARAKAEAAAAEARAKAEAAAAEARARAEVAGAEAKARIVAVMQEQKTKSCEENSKRLVISATSRAEVAEARCREAEAKRRVVELGPLAAKPQPTQQRPRMEVAPWQDINETHHLERPLRGQALADLKALPPHPDYNAYRAAGIPDNAVPRDAAQAKQWYDLACHQQAQLRPVCDAEARLRPRGSRDVYGEPVRPEFCVPPFREPAKPVLPSVD
jgi:hypothetical protein